jgi:hypothetical protein
MTVSRAGRGVVRGRAARGTAAAGALARRLETGAMCCLAPAGAAVSTPATDDLEFNKNAANSTRDSCNARGWRDRRRPCDQLCQPAKVLCNRRQRELELRARGTAKAQSAKPQNSLEVCEQHLDLFAIAA